MSKTRPSLSNKERVSKLLAPLATGLYLSCQETEKYYEDLDMALEAAFFESYQEQIKTQFEDAGIEIDST
jgi:hypothetical protein